jgi:hypothetical protein
VQARRPIPTFGAITWVDPVGINDYNGLSLRFEKRFSKGLYVLNSFTWGKSIGNSEQALEQAPAQNVANQQNIRNLAAEFGPSSYDVKFNNVTSVVYQLPFGKGKKYLGSVNRMAELAIGGWELNGINTASTGIPLNVYYAWSAAQDVTGLANNSEYRGTSMLRPNITGPVPSLSRNQSIANWFGPPIGSPGSVFTLPTNDQPFGNLGRNAFRAPGLAQWDLGVTKNFNFTETIRLQFRSEFFNVLNHTNFGIPSNQQANNASFGSITGTFPARQVQFGMKLLF